MGEVIKGTTPEFRVSFPNVFKAKAFNNQEPKFNIVMLFDKDADISELKKMANQAAKAKWGDKIPSGIRSPFRDGNDKDYDGYEDCTFIGATSKLKPGLIDRKHQAILDESEFYAGCYARAVVTAFAYDKAGNKGVSFGLQHVQKLRDGEAFSGRGKAEDAFDKIGGGENEEDYSNNGDSLFN